MNHAPAPTGEITETLKAFRNGDKAAMCNLAPLIYDERKPQAHRFLNKERKNHTLQTTALVHEACLRLIEQKSVSWQNRAHFFTFSATTMRRILVSYAKVRNRKKRGGPVENITLGVALAAGTEDRDIDPLAFDESPNELATLNAKQARIVELRYFSGLTIKETARVLQISPATVRRESRMAKTWLKAELEARTAT